METKQTSNTKGLIFQWVLINIIVVGVIMPVAILIYDINNTESGTHNITNQILVNTILTAVVSFLFGFFQWQILKPHVMNSKGWLWTSFLGLGIGLSIALGENYFVVNLKMTDASEWLLTGSTIGIALGLAQWLFLRQRVKLASVWIIANILSWSIGLELSWLYWSSTNSDSIGIFLDFAAFMFIFAITYSVTTGFLLAWLLNHPSKNLQTTAA